MPTIKLKGNLDFELTRLGLESGQIVDATPDIMSKKGAMHFTRHKFNMSFNCTVWPENYEILAVEHPNPANQ
jgi:hypothetical protein